MIEIKEVTESTLKFTDAVTKGCYIEDTTPYEEMEKERMAEFLSVLGIVDMVKEYPYSDQNSVCEGVPIKHYI